MKPHPSDGTFPTMSWTLTGRLPTGVNPPSVAL